jgi:hypothetical protein
MGRSRFCLAIVWGVRVGGVLALSGCTSAPVPPVPPGEAEYIGARTCTACHPNLKASHDRHAHAQALKAVEGRSPIYPDVGVPVGVPVPPDGLEWFDVDFVVGGYSKGANFVASDGFVLTDGTSGFHSQYNLALRPARRPAEYVAYRPHQTAAMPFDFACFRCHTTGALSLDENDGRRQGNRPGVGGTWAEEGVQCEACHGPGSRHPLNPGGGTIDVAGASESCARCHVDPERPDVLTAADGLVSGFQQYTEVEASPHRGFACTVCHDPHASALYDRAAGLRNECMDCHPYRNMAMHEGKVFQWGDYTEPLGCESCHMSFAARSVASRELDLDRGLVIRIGDTHSHLMNINVGVDDPLDVFTPDGTEVLLDEKGQAALPSCYVCLRCHHGLGNAFALPPSEGSCRVGEGIH